MSKERVLAKRYSKAVFGLARDEGLEERVGSDLSKIVSANGLCPDLLRVLSIDAVSLTAKHDVVDKLAKYLDLNPLAVRFVHQLIDARRVSIFGLIQEEYEQQRAAYHSIVYADVTVAEDMDEATAAKLNDALALKTGRQVVLRLKRDKGLIGGMAIRIGDKVYDGSIATEMRQLECRLREICM